MGLFHYLWSRTAASNATADSNINWAEGQAPSSVNDSARAMMASAAAFRDDIAGAIVTGGTSTAYTVTSYQIFDTLAHMSGQVIAFTPHTTNGATVTLNVDGLGAKPLRSAPSVELPAGVLVQGTPYVATYNNSDAAWYLQNFFVNPYSAPVGGMMDFIGSTTPNSAFVFPYGQAVSRSTYSILFSLVSTTYGSGDGSTTFNLPDLRGRVVAGKDDMGGSAASRLSGTTSITVGGSTVLGGSGGGETNTLTLSQLPTGITSANASQVINLTSNPGSIFSVTSTGALASSSFQGGGTGFQYIPNGNGAVQNPGQITNSISVTSNNTSGSAHNNVQPTIILNKILRII